MRAPLAGLIVIAALVPALASPDTAPRSLLASAPVDATLFRDGEVGRSVERFGAWTLVCDVIARLGHKFCSLWSGPVRLGGAAVEVVVSTGDDGRPAALMRLPFGLSLPFGVRVEIAGTAGQGRHVPIALCGASGCEAVWTLTPGELAALRSGAGLRLSVQGWRFGAGGHDPQAPAPVAAMLKADGFSDAVTASLQ